MIARSWRGTTRPEKADAYVRHLRESIFPAIRSIEGHRGAYILRRDRDGLVEFLVLTLWSSMAAIERFAGKDKERAVVPPEARDLLESFDPSVEHFEVVTSPDPIP